MRTDQYQGHDYYLMDELLSDEHKLIRDSARAWVKQEVSPMIEDSFEKGVFDQNLIPGLASIGSFGPYIPEEYGGAGLDQISYGLIMQELERCDSGLRSTASVQSSLVMYPIWKYGNEEQRKKYLPKLASGEWIGCFGLTEPDHGSNPGGMVTNIKDMGDHYLLNGAKMWISNAPFAQIGVVWAKNEEGRIKGIIVERGMEGFTTPTMHGKWSLRASDTGELVFDNVKVPKENLLPNKDGLGAPLGCLDSARYGIAWGAIGAALDCYDSALRYSKERKQFNRPIGGFQLQQKKIGRDDHRDHQGSIAHLPTRAIARRRTSHFCTNFDGQAQQRRYGLANRTRGTPDSWRYGCYQRILHYATHDEPRKCNYLRRHARHPLAHYRTGHYRRERFHLIFSFTAKRGLANACPLFCVLAFRLAMNVYPPIITLRVTRPAGVRTDNTYSPSARPEVEMRSTA